MATVPAQIKSTSLPWPWYRVAVFLVVTNGIITAPSLAYVPLIPMIKQSLGITFTQLGLFSGLSGILAMVCSVPAGMAMNKAGTRRVFLIGAVVMTIGLVLLAASDSFGTALTGRGVWQGGLRFALPALTASIVTVAPPSRRSTLLGISMAFSMLVSIAVQNTAAVIGEASGWHLAIGCFAALVGLGFLVFYVGYRPERVINAEGFATLLQQRSTDRNVFLRPSVWLLCLLVIFACEEGLVDNLAVVQMREHWQTSAAEFARISSFGMALGILANLSAGWCADKFGRWNMLIVSCTLNTMVGVCLLLGQDAVKSVFIVGILIAKALQLTTAVLVNSMAPSFLRGRDVGPIVAVIALGGGVGQYVGPQVLGLLRDRTQTYTAGWLFITASGLAAVLIAIGFKLYFGRAKQQAASP